MENGNGCRLGGDPTLNGWYLFSFFHLFSNTLQCMKWHRFIRKYGLCVVRIESERDVERGEIVTATKYFNTNLKVLIPIGLWATVKWHIRQRCDKTCGSIIAAKENGLCVNCCKTLSPVKIECARDGCLSLWVLNKISVKYTEKTQRRKSK